MSFRPSNMLQKYLDVQPRDRYDIVGALMGYINADPKFKTREFDQALQYVLESGVKEKELYVPFDPDMPFEEDKAKWDEKYYSFARVYLKDNFCEKRIDHVKKVAKKLYSSSNQTAAAVQPGKGQTSAGGSEKKGGPQESGKKHQIGSALMKEKRIMGVPVAVKVVIAVMVLALLIGLIVAIV